jgi:hypothetical protein
VTAFLTWLAQTALGVFFKQLFSTAKEAWNDWLATKNAREAGRAEAQAEQNANAAKRTQDGDLAEAEARRDHANADVAKDPDAGLDTDFRRGRE